MQDKKKRLIKYLVCFCIASLIAVAIFAIKGFFTDSVSVNIQILSDGFSVSGLLMTMFAAMWFISGEGGFLGIGYVLQNVVQAFVPMGRKNHQSYAQYRESKLEKLKKPGDHCILFTGLLFLAVGIILTVIWSELYYQMPV